MKKLKIREKIFLKFLNFYWLRPEKALLHTLRAEKYIETLKYFKGKTLDVSCGDGIFSFFCLGGELSIKDDQYKSLKKNNINLTDDIYDYFDNNKYEIKIKKNTKKKFSLGSDYKINLINKSRKLNLYKNFLLHDNNKKLPKSIGKYDFIYANSTYWVKNFEQHISDLIDKTNKKGKLILSLKGNELNKKKFLDIIKSKFGNNTYKILDRGRRESWKGLKDYKYYIKFLRSFKQCKIVKVNPIFDREFLNIWDIGLRPLLKPLLILANSANYKDLYSSKKLFVETIFKIFKNYLIKYQPKKNSAIEWLIVLEKK